MSPELQTHFLNLYSIALADSDFDENEIAIIYKIGEERGIPKETIDSLFLNPVQNEYLYLPVTLSEKIEYLFDYAKLILADGVIHHEELLSLNKFCAKFQFEEINIGTIVQLLIEAAKNDVPKEDLINFVKQNN